MPGAVGSIAQNCHTAYKNEIHLSLLHGEPTSPALLDLSAVFNSLSMILFLTALNYGFVCV